MAVDIRVQGAEALAQLARDLRRAGEKDLRRELFRAINSATKPARQDVVQSTSRYLPDAYAATLSPSLKIRTRHRAGRNPGVSILAKARGQKRDRLIGPLDRGRLRHPLFGNRKHWYTQRVKPGFFREPIEARAPEIRQALLAAIFGIRAKLARKQYEAGIGRVL